MRLLRKTFLILSHFILLLLYIPGRRCGLEAATQLHDSHIPRLQFQPTGRLKANHFAWDTYTGMGVGNSFRKRWQTTECIISYL